MPEIWLPYGDLEVAVEMKSEHLSEIVEPKIPSLPDEEASELLSSLKGLEPIVMVDVNPGTLKILGILLDLSKEKELEVRCEVTKLSQVKKICEGKTSKIHSLGKPDTFVGFGEGLKFHIPKFLIEDRNKLIISETRLDPMFGFLGGSTSILNLLGKDAMKGAFGRWNKEPQPGMLNDLSGFADSVAKLIKDLTSVEVVADGKDLSAIYVGSVEECHSKATEVLRKSISQTLGSKTKVIVASPGPKPYDATLSSSIKSIWNIIPGMKENGSLILVCECAEGLGSSGLELYLSGRLTPEDLEKGRYVEGAEDVYYAKKLSAFDITFVSTLPSYYIEGKLGFHSARRASDALLSILENHGPRTKALIIPKASTTLITTRDS